MRLNEASKLSAQPGARWASDRAAGLTSYL